MSISQDTNITVHLTNNNHTKVINTSLTDSIRDIIESDGFEWFEAVQGPIELSFSAFVKVEKLITPDPG